MNFSLLLSQKVSHFIEHFRFEIAKMRYRNFFENSLLRKDELLILIEKKSSLNLKEYSFSDNRERYLSEDNLQWVRPCAYPEVERTPW